MHSWVDNAVRAAEPLNIRKYVGNKFPTLRVHKVCSIRDRELIFHMPKSQWFIVMMQQK